MINRFPKYLLNLIFFSGLAIAVNGCSTPSESFDCKEGKGVGCKSISAVNQMVNDGALGQATEPGMPVMPAPVVVSEAISVSGLDILETPVLGGPHIQRVGEQSIRVWVAPFQDAQGNYHEGSVVHTILKPGFWHISEAR